MAAFGRKKWLLGGFLALSLALPCGVYGASPPVGDAGIASYYAGDYDSAIQHLKAALAAKPDDPNLRYYLADALAKQERYEEARLEYRRIADGQPDSKAGLLSSKALGMLDNRFKRWTVTVTKVKTRDLDWEVSSKIRYPDPVELQKELGERVTLDQDNVEDVSLGHLADAKAELAKLPPGMVEKFLENKGEIRVVGSLMSVERTSSGHDRMDAAGLCDVQPGGRIFIYLTVQGLESGEKTNVTLHEMGHAMDFLAADTKYGYGFSRSEEFKTLFANERIRDYLKNIRRDGYYASAPQEAFAEMFALYFNSAATRRQLPGEAITYMETVVIPKFEEKQDAQTIQF